MNLHLAADANDLSLANAKLIAVLKKSARLRWRNHPIGFRGETVHRDVFWNKRHKFWFVISENHTHYWLAFGKGVPQEKKALEIAVEINTPRLGRHPRAGKILKDDKLRLFLAHSGRIGGGRPGVSRKEFLASYLLAGRKLIEYGNGEAAILIGRIDTSLAKRINDFLNVVVRFKSRTLAPRLIQLPPPIGKKFRPKATGKRRYRTKGIVESDLRHDLVATELCRRLKGNNCRYDKRRDVFVVNGRGRQTVLFEIKTDVSSQSVYTGAGQLLINGRSSAQIPRLVLVLPGLPANRAVISACSKLKVNIFQYRWSKDGPRFASKWPAFARP